MGLYAFSALSMFLALIFGILGILGALHTPIYEVFIVSLTYNHPPKTVQSWPLVTLSIIIDALFKLPIILG